MGLCYRDGFYRKSILNKIFYHIALYGTDAGDRQRPHIHIYLDGDK